MGRTYRIHIDGVISDRILFDVIINGPEKPSLLGTEIESFQNPVRGDNYTLLDVNIPSQPPEGEMTEEDWYSEFIENIKFFITDNKMLFDDVTPSP